MPLTVPNLPLPSTLGRALTVAEAESLVTTLRDFCNGLAGIVNGTTDLEGNLRDGVVKADAIENDAVTLDKLSDAVGFVPVGVVSPYAGVAAPDGWLLCKGQAVLRADYEALYALIGETYGAGDGLNTFNVPDLSGRIPVGVGQATSVAWNETEADYSSPGSTFALAQTGGTENHSLTEPEMPEHTHEIPSRDSDGTGGTGDYYESSGGSLSGVALPFDTTATGESYAHNNLQPYIALAYIIKT